MDALLVVDMQIGLFIKETPRYDASGVVRRINCLAEAVRGKGGIVLFIQHDGPEGDILHPGAAGWELLPDLDRNPNDPVIRKRACDSFYKSGLEQYLKEKGVDRIIITGCATDFCVDSTVRSASSKDYEVIVVADAHTTANRPHLDAEAIIGHHNWVWENLILPEKQVKVVDSRALLEGAKP